MKVLIAYDGSASADTGIEGLQRAGLPTDAHGLVVSIAEVWLPPPSDADGPAETFPVLPGLKRAREQAARILKDAQAVAERGDKFVQKHFPGWRVKYEVGNGSPAFEILNRADEWKPDLIVVGSQGRTALGRFVLGSVSQKVLTEASTSVRIARRMTGSGSSGERIVVGIDGSKGSQAAIRAVGRRRWTPGSEVRLVVAQDLIKASPASMLIPSVRNFVHEVNEDERFQEKKIVEAAGKDLRDNLDERVSVSAIIANGDPKQVLVRHAEEFGADCIFTGATGFSNRIERFVLGSVSAAVAARAHCSVEVVR